MGQAARLPLPSILMAGLAVLVCISLPRLVNSDSAERFTALEELFGHGEVPRTKYSVIGPLFAAPLWRVGHATGNAEQWVWLFNRLLFLAGACGFWWALRPALSGAAVFRFLLILTFASMLPYHLFYFGGEVFTAVCVGVGTAAAVLKRAWWGWALAALGAASIPGTIPGFALAATIACWHFRRVRYLLPVLLAVGLVFLENGIRRGDAVNGGYGNDHGFASVLPYSGRPGFSYPLVFGVMSILLSFGKGLVFFTPGLFVPPGTPDGEGDTPTEADLRLLWRMWVGLVVGLVLVYARWWSWYGGWFWGPRFFLFACLPASLVLVRRATPPFRGTLAGNLVTILVLALSCWVGANGVVYQQYGDEAFLADDYALEFLTWYVPECSPLWRPFVQEKSLDGADGLRLLAFGTAAIYLLTPLAIEVLRQLRAEAVRAWSSRGRFRVRF